MRRRLLFFSLLLLIGLALVGATDWARDEARLAAAEAALVNGEAEVAAAAFADLSAGLWHRRTGSAGVAAAAALDGNRNAAPPPFAAADLRLPLAIHAAFARGDVAAALRLSELPGALVGPVPLVRAAAQIETGRTAEARTGDAMWRDAPGRLARRVRRFLADPNLRAAAERGALLRDRRGNALASVDGDLLRFADGVDGELIPRALAELAPTYDGAGSLRTSLDLELSRAARESLGHFRGSIVLVEPTTGEILAAVSDRVSHRRGGTPAFEQYREPASISKVITAAAAQRAGVDPDAAMRRMSCRGHAQFAGEMLYCSSITGRLGGLDRAMATSCNVAFARLGVDIGRPRLVGELRRWGFDEPAGDLPGPRILAPSGDDRQLADLAIGLEATAVTPLHGALIAAVVANGGVLPTPTLFTAADGHLGLHARALPREPGERVLEPASVRQLERAMRAVARRGTGAGMAPRGFPVAMKTGTASDRRYGFHVNYIGYGPLPGARVAFCVRITDQRTSKRVRDAGRYVTTRLLTRLDRAAGRRGWHDGPPSAYRLAERPAHRDSAAGS